MSLFRKPKKFQPRVFCADDEDDGDMDPQPPPPPVISKPKKQIPIKSTPLLSFADEEEDGEVFKVKKSKQSSRLAKKREKERKRPPDGDTNQFDNNVIEEENNIENDVLPKPKKKVTLEGLILSGREALAADGAGDISEESEHEEEDSRGFHQYRAESVRAALAQPGHIPDAALIHAARKTRQQARELGDFVPIHSESKPGSRLVRDDDGSGDDDEGRIQVRGLELPSDKPMKGTAAEPTNEELGSEPDEWEEQQIKKAMPALVDLSGEGEINPFALPPPPPRLEVAPHLQPLALPTSQPATAQDLLDALRLRLQELQAERDAAQARADEIKQRLERAMRVRTACTARRGELNGAYRRAQAARGYLTDLVECLDEKMPALEALEGRALSLYRRRCEFLVERRRADVRDQAQDVLALAARPGAAKPVDSEEKRRRAAEREGRRRARRLAREAAAHADGDSSDDDLPPHEAQHHATEREAVRSASRSLFVDALPAWRSVGGVCARLQRWRRQEPSLYCQAYLPDCLPRLLAPYIRHQLILWNPLADEDNEDFEKMDWYRCLMMYGVKSEKLPSDSEDSSPENGDEETPQVTDETVREDPDLFLVPTIVNKVLVPKLVELVEHAWDPMCVRATIRLRGLMIRAAALPSCRSALPRLAAAVRARLASALNADVFLPALPPHVMEGAGGQFWRRCVGAGVRLLRATLALTSPPHVLHADPVVLQLLDLLCTAAGAAPAVNAASACSALAHTVPRPSALGPDGPLRAAALARIARLARLALSRLQPDNPLHLKALEQVRNVIAEAKATE